MDCIYVLRDVMRKITNHIIPEMQRLASDIKEGEGVEICWRFHSRYRNGGSADLDMISTLISMSKREEINPVSKKIHDAILVEAFGETGPENFQLYRGWSTQKREGGNPRDGLCLRKKKSK